jgi:hypothetical protein
VLEPAVACGSWGKGQGRTGREEQSRMEVKVPLCSKVLRGHGGEVKCVTSGWLLRDNTREKSYPIPEAGWALVAMALEPFSPQL